MGCRRQRGEWGAGGREESGVQAAERRVGCGRKGFVSKFCFTVKQNEVGRRAWNIHHSTIENVTFVQLFYLYNVTFLYLPENWMTGGRHYIHLFGSVR